MISASVVVAAAAAAGARDPRSREARGKQLMMGKRAERESREEKRGKRQKYWEVNEIQMIIIMRLLFPYHTSWCRLSLSIPSPFIPHLTASTSLPFSLHRIPRDSLQTDLPSAITPLARTLRPLHLSDAVAFRPLMTRSLVACRTR